MPELERWLSDNQRLRAALVSSLLNSQRSEESPPAPAELASDLHCLLCYVPSPSLFIFEAGFLHASLVVLALTM